MPETFTGQALIPPLRIRFKNRKRGKFSVVQDQASDLNDQQWPQAAFTQLRDQLSARVLGQPDLIERLLIAVLADGHVLLEGPPGLAKTRVAFLLANAFDASFQRVQFTPDLLPADLTGTTVYDPREHHFNFHAGPLFNQFILADEINRAPAKVQAALLEAMEERQITVGGESRPLQFPFFVVATQNPLEEEGTYELPVAQLDRFVLRVLVDYPDTENEAQILDMVQRERRDSAQRTPPVSGLERVSLDSLTTARSQVLDVFLSDPVKDYIIRLIAATRGDDDNLSDLTAHIAHPVSPRGTLALAHLSQARAWLAERDHVRPEDVQALASDVLSHRIGLTYRAQAEGINAHSLIKELLDRVALA